MEVNLRLITFVQRLIGVAAFLIYEFIVEFFIENRTSKVTWALFLLLTIYFFISYIKYRIFLVNRVTLCLGLFIFCLGFTILFSTLYMGGFLGFFGPLAAVGSIGLGVYLSILGFLDLFIPNRKPHLKRIDTTIDTQLVNKIIYRIRRNKGQVNISEGSSSIKAEMNIEKKNNHLSE